ncbi:MAG: DUF5667 domain-containing protein [Actinomycetota bacterium]|nr:DUF5667 domain-containing protein [Actinomycetota bacterium]
MTTGAGRDSERFAAAVDNGHTYAGAVPLGDEFLARELELVALLRESRASLAPSPDASVRMRARVMAAAATMVAPVPAMDGADGTGALVAASLSSDSLSSDIGESAEDETNVVSIGGARGRHRFPRRLSAAETPHRRGAFGLSAAAALALLAVTGGGALFSKDALPGDTLYGVKQTTESGLVALTPGQGKAQRQLDVAATRIDEVQALSSSRAASADRGSDISQALHGFNEQTTAASRTWLAGPNPGNTGDLATWASTQSQRLAAMRSSMPASAQPDADSSMHMLEQLRTRASALNSRKGCDNVTTGESDEFGPIPAKGACNTKDSTPQAPQARQMIPNMPTNERSGAPSLNTSDRTGQLPATDRTGQLPATGGNSNPAPSLNLPELPGTSSGGLLSNRQHTSQPATPQPDKDKHLPLLDN